MGIPYETLRNYFKGSKSPRPENLRRLAEFTGLDLSPIQKPKRATQRVESKESLKHLLYSSRVLEDLECELAKSLAALAPARKALLQQEAGSKGVYTRRAQIVQLLMDALQRNIDQFLDDPDALAMLRHAVSGSDAGYLSGLLGALFDDQRLERWREMTTYRYGSK